MTLVATTAACGAATPQPEQDGPHVSASLSNGGGKDGAGSARLARALRDRKTLDTGCPSEMAPVDQRTGRFCVDRWEAGLVDVLPTGEERAHSPFYPVGSATVRAVSRPNVFPQGYISAVQAQAACAASG